MLYKNVSESEYSGVIKDVDVKAGIVTGYFSRFGNIDSDGDMVMKGAFKRTLNNNYKRLKHLFQHNTTQVLAGTRKDLLKVQEDAIGLYFESKITETTLGKDTLLLYESGALDEHSIGYEVVDQKKASGYNELRELKLWEGSTVTWGANPLATANGLKSLTKEQAVNKLDIFLKELRNGKYEQEEVFDILEIQIKQIQQHILDLSTQPVIKTPAPQKSLNADLILSFIHLQTN